MKHFKKFFSYLVALTMVLSLAAFTGVKVHAADGTGYTLTLNNNNGKTDHTFEVYQIFTGDLSGDTLSNIKWGNGVNTQKEGFSLGDAAEKAEELATSKNQDVDAKAFAESLQSYLQNGIEKKVLAGGKDSITRLAAGYYLVKDKVDDKGKSTQNGKEKGATTSYILQVVKDTEAKSKLDVPTVEKKVKDTNDSTGVTSDWQDSADADINDTVEYQITGTMPANIADYTSYKYIFTDTMSPGLTYTASTDTQKNYKVMLYTSALDTTGTDVTSAFSEDVKEATSNDEYKGGHKITWSCSDLKSKDLTKKATKDSKFVLTYNATLDKKSAVIGSAGNPNKVDLTYSNNPNKGGEGETGKTPEDKNIVFTYKLDVNKYKDNKDDVNNKTDEAEFKLYKEIKGTNDKPDSVNEVNLTKANKVYSAVGLDDGVYILQETEAPAGYNKMDGSVKVGSTTYENAIKFEISATHDTTSDDPKLTELTGNVTSGNVTSGEATFTPDTSAGSLTADVVDKKGSVLPSTGGMGTTLLYVAGGILVACAAAYVVMSRKHSTNK